MRLGYFGGSFDPPHNGHLAVARAARDGFQLDRVLLAPTARQPLKPKGPEVSFADRLRMTTLLCAGEPYLEASAIDGPQPNGQANYTADTLRRLHASLAATPSSSAMPSLAVNPSLEVNPSIEANPSLEANPSRFAVTSLSGCHSRREPAFPTAASAPASADPQLFAIVGADAFDTFPHWREPEALLQLADWIVVSRPGSATPDLGRLTTAERSRIHVLNGLANPISATALRARLRAGEDCRGLVPTPVLDLILAEHLYAAP